MAVASPCRRWEGPVQTEATPSHGPLRWPRAIPAGPWSTSGTEAKARGGCPSKIIRSRAGSASFGRLCWYAAHHAPSSTSETCTRGSGRPSPRRVVSRADQHVGDHVHRLPPEREQIRLDVGADDHLCPGRDAVPVGVGDHPVRCLDQRHARIADRQGGVGPTGEATSGPQRPLAQRLAQRDPARQGRPLQHLGRRPTRVRSTAGRRRRAWRRSRLDGRPCVNRRPPGPAPPTRVRSKPASRPDRWPTRPRAGSAAPTVRPPGHGRVRCPSRRDPLRATAGSAILVVCAAAGRTDTRPARPPAAAPGFEERLS